MLFGLLSRKRTPVVIKTYTGTGLARFAGSAITQYVPQVFVIRSYTGTGLLRLASGATTLSVPQVFVIRAYVGTGLLRSGGTAPTVPPVFVPPPVTVISVYTGTGLTRLAGSATTLSVPQVFTIRPYLGTGLARFGSGATTLSVPQVFTIKTYTGTGLLLLGGAAATTIPPPPAVIVKTYTPTGRAQLGGAALISRIINTPIPAVIKVYTPSLAPVRFGAAALTSVVVLPPPITEHAWLPTGQLTFLGQAATEPFTAPGAGHRGRIGRRGRSAPFPTRSLTVVTTGPGIVTSQPGGISCGALCAATYSHGTVVQLTATPNASAAFVQWGGDVLGSVVVGNTLLVSLDQARVITALFQVVNLTRRLTVTSGGSGTISTTPVGISVMNATAAFDFPSGQLVALTATPNAGYQFDGYSGACGGLTCSVFMDTDLSVNGSFSLIPVVTRVLSIARIGTGVGQVDSSPVGIQCGGTCSALFGDGVTVTLTASSTAGNTFIGWTGAVVSTANPVQVLMNANKQVTAQFNFVTTAFLLSITKSGTGTGSVVSAPAGITCGGTCSASYVAGTNLTLTATPDPTCSFTGWTGSLTSTNNPLSVTMGAAVSLVATFAAAPPPLAPIVALLAIYERAGVTRTADPLDVVVPLSETDAVKDPAQLDVRFLGDVVPSQFRVLSRYGDVGDTTASIRVAQGCFLPSVQANAVEVDRFQVTTGGLHPTIGGITYTQDASFHRITTGFGNGAIDCYVRKAGAVGHNVFDQLWVRQANAWVSLIDTNNASTYVLHGVAAQGQNADYASRTYANSASYTTAIEWQGTERLVLLVKTRLGTVGGEFSGSGFETRLTAYTPSVVPTAVTIEARYTFTKDSGLIEMDVLWKGPDGDWLHPCDAYLSGGGIRIVPNFGGTGAQLAVFDESNLTTKAATTTHSSGNTNVVYYDYAPSGTSYNFSRPATNWAFAGATTDTVVGTEGWYAMGDASSSKWMALMQTHWKETVATGFRYDGTIMEITLWPSERGHVPSGPVYHILGGTHYYRWRGAMAFGTGPLVPATIRNVFTRRLAKPLLAHAQDKWQTSGALFGTPVPVGFVLGSDGNRYRARINHTATLATKPITGASFLTAWVLDNTNVSAAAALPWVAGRRYGVLFYGSILLNEALSRRARWALQYVDSTASTDAKTIQTTYTSRNAGVYSYYGWNRWGCWIGAAASGASCGCNRDETIEALLAAWIAYGDVQSYEWADRMATHMGGFASWKGSSGRTGTLQFGSLAPGIEGDTTKHLPEPDFVDGAERNGISYRPLAYLYTGYQPYRDLANLALASHYGKTLDQEQQGLQPHRSPVTSINQTSLTGIPGGNQPVGGTRIIGNAITFFAYTFLMQGDTLSLQLARNLMVQGLIYTHRAMVGLEYAPTNTSGTLTAEGGLGTVPVGVRDNTGLQAAVYAALPTSAIKLITQLAIWCSTRAPYNTIISADVTAMTLFVKQYVKYHLTGANALSRNLADAGTVQILDRPLVRGGNKLPTTVNLIGSTPSWTINTPGADGSTLRATVTGVIALGDAAAIQHQLWTNLIDLTAYAGALYQTEGNATLANYARGAARELFENLYLYAAYPTVTAWATPIAITARGNIVTGSETT